MAVNRVVLQHMSINLAETHIAEGVEPQDEEEEVPLKENIEPKSNSSSASCASSTASNGLKMAEKRKAPPFGLSPPSESKLMQRRKQSQSLIVIGSNGNHVNNNTCSKESANAQQNMASGLGKNSSSFVNVADLVTASPGLIESPSC